MAEKLKTKSIIDFLNCLFQDKTPWEELSEMDRKAFSPYMVQRWVSMHPDYVGVINYLQQYTMTGMSNKEIYRLFLDFFPRQKFWAKYIKSKAEADAKISKELIDFVRVQEEWSSDETYDNLSMILSQKNGSDLLLDYLKLYGIDSKEANKKYGVK